MRRAGAHKIHRGDQATLLALARQNPDHRRGRHHERTGCRGENPGRRQPGAVLHRVHLSRPGTDAKRRCDARFRETMLIGVPKEIKDHEFRVGLTPAGVRALVGAGHEVHVQTQAGAAIGYRRCALCRSRGAHRRYSRRSLRLRRWSSRSRNPRQAKFRCLHEGQVLFTYLHLAADAGPDPPTAGTQNYRHRLRNRHRCARAACPCSRPMSEVAGRIAIQAGATALQMANGGSGVLLGGVPGVVPGKVAVLGAGTVGTECRQNGDGTGCG